VRGVVCSFCSEVRLSVHVMRNLPATDIMKYVYRGNLPGTVSDILPAVMPRAVVTEHPFWWLGGGTGFNSDIVCYVTFLLKTVADTRFHRL
jgi:hypothetical protein